MCSFVTQHKATDSSSFDGVCIGMLTAELSTRAVASKNVNFSTISAYNIILENLAVRPTGLTTADHV